MTSLIDRTEERYRSASVNDEKPFRQWKPSQRAGLEHWWTLGNQRWLVFYPTGEGKTKLSLAALWARDYHTAVVVAPPKTQATWQKDARVLGLKLIFMSHEKFRMAGTKLPRDTPIIVDEFHKLGKHNAVGFRKLDRMAAGFPAIILCSATPNYNDAERCYNVGHVLDPVSYRGTFLKWIQENCVTRHNPFATTPFVDGFKNYDGAADFLASQPFTSYIEDTADWTPIELPLPWPDLSEFAEYGYSRRKHRIMASMMEAKHHVKRLRMLTTDEKFIRPEVWDPLMDYLENTGNLKTLFFSADKVLAKALYNTFERDTGLLPFLITGDGTATQAQVELEKFLAVEHHSVLIGTSALATGVDGIDRVTNHLLIFDDTEDNTLRRQLIGRVLPRGDYERETIVTTVS